MKRFAPRTSSSSEVKLAIVIPVFKHSMLIAEAIESALSQVTDFEFRVVIINDGCPYPETELTCSAYARTYPNRVHYLRKKNGGLSSARNFGIEYSLEEWPHLQAIYLLDADNRLLPASMQRAFNCLAQAGFKGWVYPDIDMFGYPWYGDFSGSYSVLTHLTTNICEAGSMISRDLLDRGVRFDESMRLGFEDWEFWLAAAETGARGHHCPGFGFQYRKRAESMLSDSNRDSEEIISYVRRKHAKLYKPAKIVSLEQEESPRYAIYLADTQQYLLTTDPDTGIVMSTDEFHSKWWSAIAAPHRHSMPGFMVTTSSKTLKLLSEKKLLHWTLWRLEDALARKNFSFCNLENVPLSEKVEVKPHAHSSFSGGQRMADLCMVKFETIMHSIRDQRADWIFSIQNEVPDMPVFNLKLCFNWPSGARSFKAAVTAFLSRFMDWRESDFVAASLNHWGWKDPGQRPGFNAYLSARQAARINAPLLPMLQLQNRRDVAFILPLAKFGGVEKVAFSTGRQMARNGWRVHFIVQDEPSIQLPSDGGEFLTSIHFLNEPSKPNWSGKKFYGTGDDDRNQSASHDRLISLLGQMDLVINAHCAFASGAMAKLRRLGVKTASHLHVLDESEHGRPVGHPYLALAYEHAYDYFLTCSYQMADWLHAMGIPSAKLVPLPNGPGYMMSIEEAEAHWQTRTFYNRKRPLRVLFMGRFDRQKGLERVIELAKMSKASRAEIEWRIIGGNILEEGNEDEGTAQILLENGIPAIYENAQLSEQYRWADILLLPSHWEGLPLTIIEAARLGCVTLATRVGAIAEVVTHGSNGLLIDEYSHLKAFELLRSVLDGTIDMRDMAMNARTTIGQRTWEHSMCHFANLQPGSRVGTELDCKHEQQSP